ncbi:hypothetical protein F4824DRAFT_400607 [Ustulina deusta]|nr:hypothetical protein F4824DRAFT_400607 [Ustulina deusta]
MEQELPWAEPPWLSSLASPYYNESHRKLQAYARKYFDENVIPHMLEWEEKGDCPGSAKVAYLKSGLALPDVPKEYRPREYDTVAGIPFAELDVFHRLILTDEASRIEGGVATMEIGRQVKKIAGYYAPHASTIYCRGTTSSNYT